MMPNKIAKFKFGERVKNSKKKILTISGAYKLGAEIYYYVNESSTQYPEHELEPVAKEKTK